MTLSRSPLQRLFRNLILGMLVLAIAGKPLLSEFCNVHSLTHLIAAGEAAGDHGHDHAPIHVDTAAEARSDHDHGSGAHQLLHASDASPAFVEPFAVLTVPPSHFRAIAPAPFSVVAPPARGFESPFRPPIA